MLLLALWGASGCARAPADPRPSFLLVVLDTVRADAVSALGSEPGVTPAFDALARAGLLYAHAYAEAPWTVPSHASLFSGLGVEHHGVGAARRVVLPEAVETLAERLAAEGYETVGLSENPLVSAPFGLSQGFERYAVRSGEDLVAESWDSGTAGFVMSNLETWTRRRRPGRPFFLFVNLMDAHEPYAVREANPFLPEGADAGAARRLRQSTARICDAIPPPPELALLRGLYLGDVAAADRKLAAIRTRLAERGLAERLVTIVTSDHGEHLGEDRLLDHQFSVHNVLLHVPLVVHGVAGAAPARIEAPVSLLDLAPSLLAWAGAEPAAELSGRPLPVAEPAQPARPLLAVYGGEKPGDWPEAVRVYPGEKREHCGPGDRVFGDMATLTRYPLKLVWYRHHAPRLFDLSWDPRERSDLAAQRPEVRERLASELRERLETSGVFEADPAEPAAPPEAVERLRSLGYVE